MFSRSGAFLRLLACLALAARVNVLVLVNGRRLYELLQTCVVRLLSLLKAALASHFFYRLATALA